MGANKECIFPECPSGIHYDGISKKLDTIEGKQDRHYEEMTRLGGIVERLVSIDKELDRNEKAHTNLFARLNTLEVTGIRKADVVKIFIVGGIILGAIQFIVPYLHLAK